MLKSISPLTAAWLVLAITLATILGAWGFEYAGYLPCELCLKQRFAYYTAVPLSLIVALAGARSPALLRYGLYALGLIMLGSMVFGIYHAGVEWKFWQGPTACTGIGNFTGGLPDLTKKAVMCDQPAIRIFGLSLAGWNAVISAATSLLAFAKAREA
jgi:disulfide bond formation protein DsbB